MKTKINIFAILFLVAHIAVLGQTIANQAFQQNKNYVLGYSCFTEEERIYYSTIQDPAELIIQSEDLLKRSHKLRLDANLFFGEEKERYLKKASELSDRSIKLKLAACELTAYNNRIEFDLLKSSFIAALKTKDEANGSLNKSKKSYQLAVQSFRSAIELREEAYAQQTEEAILANLLNAEEKEISAFKHLVEASHLLENVTIVTMAKK